MPEGRVILVGAGPGDPELITLRGLRWLRRADVVVYDQLAAVELLDEAPGGALRIFAGKSARHGVEQSARHGVEQSARHGIEQSARHGIEQSARHGIEQSARHGIEQSARHGIEQSARHGIEQSAINAVLIHHARAGRLVVRLKGGDPFVFGRGGEEVLACVRAGVLVEVVPGVSAAVAVPAAAGVPVTHRGLASSFAVVTGHEDPAKSEAAVDWERLATAVDTLVILMGVGALPRIAARLIAAGRDAATPAAAIRRGTTSAQETVVGTLGDIAVRAARLAAPAVIVIGETVALRAEISPELSDLAAFARV